MLNRKRCMKGGERKLHCELLEDRRMLAPVTVSTNLDVVDGNIGSIALLISNPGPDGRISLREAIGAANQDVLNDTITFDPSLSGQVINLTTASGGQIEISGVVTIDASALSGNLTIHAAANSRIFNVTGGASTVVTLKHLLLTGGNVFSSGGGAISASASLTIERCTITGNQASAGGGVSFIGSSGANFT
jgi:hypothetical protein